MKFFGNINKGVLTMHNQEGYNHHLQSLEGKIKIDISKVGNTRTLQQNAYYWLYMGIIADDTGDNVNDLHEFLKRKLLPPQITTVLGRDIALPSSTINLPKGEFSAYIVKIEALTGILAPDTELYLYRDE